MEKCRYFVNMVMENWRCDAEIKTRISFVKEAFNKKNSLFWSTVDLKWEDTDEALYVEHSDVGMWNMDFGVERITTEASEKKKDGENKMD